MQHAFAEALILLASDLLSVQHCDQLIAASEYGEAGEGILIEIQDWASTVQFHFTGAGGGIVQCKNILRKYSVRSKRYRIHISFFVSFCKNQYQYPNTWLILFYIIN
jgi:hypothetical protein